MKDKKTVGKTSEDVVQTGTYTPDCCNVEKFFEKGKIFQRCPSCERLALWQIVLIHRKGAA